MILTKRYLLLGLLGITASTVNHAFAQKTSVTKVREITKGTFSPDYQSLNHYECPEWFRDAKFGIWAHWGPQCEPEEGDWYARNIYIQGRKQYDYHLAHYGRPSVFGFKDVITQWKAANWNPDELLKLYKEAGAQYFVAMANHHDNFDNWNSKYQPWNSVNLGPHKDLIGGWAAAAKRAGLRFGVTVHAARAWSWYDVTKNSDTSGPYKGVMYDGLSTKADGKGKLWEGYDPQDLYSQNHAPKAKPDEAYIDKFFDRTKDLIDSYHPDLLYFDDSNLPLGEAGLNLAAHFYNANKQWHNGKLEAVLNAKKMPVNQRPSVLLDIERGVNDKLDSMPWQTDDCIGQWHYKKGLKYKSASSVVNELVDIVSKNGNLLLNIPVRADGTIDADEVEFLKEMASWIKIYGEGIFKTRPWKIFGESHTVVDPKDSRKNLFTANDFRYTTKDGVLYVFLLGTPDQDIHIKTLGLSQGLASKIKSVSLMGSTQKIYWNQEQKELTINKPDAVPTPYAIAYKVNFY